MLKLLLLATAITAICAEEAKAAEAAVSETKLNIAHSTVPEQKPAETTDSELNPAESAAPVMINNDRNRDFQDGLQLNRYREQRMRANRLQDMSRDHDYDFDDHRGQDDRHAHGPVILRTINPHTHRHPDIELQNKIIADVYSPDYYQPTWILDYRYLKTGGRDYTRGPGGQILILPKGVRSNEPKDFPNFDSLLEHLRLSRLSQQNHNRRGHGREDAFQGYRTVDNRRQEYNRGQNNWFNPYQQ